MAGTQQNQASGAIVPPDRPETRPAPNRSAIDNAGTAEEIRAFNRRGLFLGGCPKSGTTLLLSLLDGHPKLVVVPEETHYLEEFPHYAALPGYPERLHRLLERSDLKLLSQRGGGRTSEAPSPNIRDYSSFDHQRFTQLAKQFVAQPAVNDSLVFTETVRAYAMVAGLDWRDCVRWVEKSTSNECCSAAFFSMFPDAKLLQVVRDPRGVFASRKKRLVNSAGSHTKAHRLVREWNRSSRQIPKWIDRRDQYLVMRYEDLVTSPRENIERACKFIGIEVLPELFAPTRGGREWQGNSSFQEAFSGISTKSVDQWKRELTADEVWWIEMHCREGMRIAGYPLQTDARFSLTRWLKRLPGESWGGYIRARRASLCQLLGLLEHCNYDTPLSGGRASILP